MSHLNDTRPTMVISSAIETELCRSLAQLHDMPLPELERTTATLMFTDIEDSTGLAAALGLTELAQFLSEHMSVVQRVVRSHGGSVMHFTGDGVCALWPSTDMSPTQAAQRALAAAGELSRQIASENRRRRADGLPTRRVRVGLHSGEVLLGSPHHGHPSVIFGAAVHLARRVEQAGKSVRAAKADVVVMVSEATLQLASSTDEKKTPAIASLRSLRGSGKVWGKPANSDSPSVECPAVVELRHNPRRLAARRDELHNRSQRQRAPSAPVATESPDRAGKDVPATQLLLCT
jgi:class 3 adenylate cyclase